MTDEDLIGYLLDALPADDQAAADAHVRANPAEAARVERLRAAFGPLEADREPAPPPPGLAVRTVARLAALLAERERDRTPEWLPAVAAVPAEPAPPGRLPAAPRDQPDPRAMGGRLRPDVLVAAGIAFVACGLVFSGVNKVREYGRRAECQNALRTLHTGLAGYADAHDGRYPQVIPASYQPPPVDATASAFKALGDAGHLPSGWSPACPSATRGPSGVGYTYSLGYRGPNQELRGLARPDIPGGEHDLIPISADYPSAAAAPGPGPVSPHPGGMNVLYLGGNVRYTTSGLAGPAGDDIFRNVFGRVAAGASRTDAVLGRPGDNP